MTRLRMLIALALCAVAFVGGAAAGLLHRPVDPGLSGGAPAAVAFVADADITSLVVRLANTGIFPAARPLEEQGEPPQNSASGAARGEAGPAGATIGASQRPPIVAIVKRADVWRIFADTGVVERSTLAMGDELYDGWVVSYIDGSRLTATRQDEELVIDVFDLPDEG